MARPLRVQYPGAVYHVMARGNHGRPIFGDDEDRQRWLKTLAEACRKKGRKRESHSGSARQRHDETAAENQLRAGCKALGLKEQALSALPKGAPEKVVLAWWLRQQTTVPLRWVSERLKMGHYTRVTQALSRMERHPVRKLKHLRQRLERALPSEQ